MLGAFNRFRKSMWPLVLLTLYGFVLIVMGATEVVSAEVDWIDTNLFTGSVVVAIFGSRLGYRLIKAKRGKIA